jgi:hypothetical protein
MELLLMGNHSYNILIKQEIGVLYLASSVNTVTALLRQINASAHSAKTGIEIRVFKRNIHSFRNFYRPTKMYGRPIFLSRQEIW